MTALDFVALGLLTLIAGGILGAFYLYLRTSYRQGGWKLVRRDFIIAVIAPLAFGASRMWENNGIQSFKRAADHGFR